MFSPRFTITNTMTADLTGIERAVGFLAAARLSDDWIRDMQANALTLEAHHTTHIEGTQLTLEQATQLLAGQTLPETDPDDVRELLNYRTAFDLVAEYVGSGEPITEALIREIHKRLVKDVRGDSATPGQYRLGQNLIVNSVTRETVYTPPPAHEVQPLMTDLVEWLNTDTGINTVLVGGIAQFQLVHIHPFVDGNGRTARLLATLVMYRGNYDFKRLFTISEFYDRDRSAYYAALQSVRDHDMDMTGWLEYYVSGLSTQMQEVQNKGEQVIKTGVLQIKAGSAGLSGTALNVFSTILREGSQTPADLTAKLHISRSTVQRQLRNLIEAGLVRVVQSSTHDPTARYEANR
ncbi:MAG: Fic family protein [Candidatus Cryosericum sp.]